MTPKVKMMMMMMKRNKSNNKGQIRRRRRLKRSKHSQIKIKLLLLYRKLLERKDNLENNKRRGLLKRTNKNNRVKIFLREHRLQFLSPIL